MTAALATVTITRKIHANFMSMVWRGGSMPRSELGER
jgi:hypothetical protein